MNSDDKFWITVCGLFAMVLVTLIVSLSIYEDRKNDKIADAIKNGADPIAASCAFESSSVGMCARVKQKE